MTADLHSLAYFSRNTMAGTEAELQTQITQILTSARRNNRRLGVTGALLFSQGCFAQVLEGELEHVEAIYNRILPDPRHIDVRLLQFTQVPVRSFGHWSMAYAGQCSATRNRLDIDGLLQDGAQITSGEAGRTLVGVLSEIIGQYDEALAAE